MIARIINNVFLFIQALFKPANYTFRNIVIFTIILMCIQYIPIESRAGVSPVKVALMSTMPLVLLAHFRVNKAFIIGTMYIGWIFFTAAVLHPATFRPSTVLYGSMFVITFIVVYTAVWNYEIFSLDDFQNIIRIFFFVLVGFLLAQQACLLVGIRLMPILNLCQVLGRGIGANSLTFEPSTLGRLLTIVYFAILKCEEFQKGEKVRITELFNGDLKVISILYIWSILTMGSGTAFVAAGLLSLYFMQGRYMFLSIPVFVGIYFIMVSMDNESFVRAQNASMATLSGNVDEVRENDTSAAIRIAPMLNTLHADFTKMDFWLGKGCDGSPKNSVTSGTANLSHIDAYGLISYILELMLVFTCIMRFNSLTTIFFFAGIAGGIGNISYGWGILMILTCVRYFESHSYEYNYLDENYE